MFFDRNVLKIFKLILCSQTFVSIFCQNTICLSDGLGFNRDTELSSTIRVPPLRKSSKFTSNCIVMNENKSVKKDRIKKTFRYRYDINVDQLSRDTNDFDISSQILDAFEGKNSAKVIHSTRTVAQREPNVFIFLPSPITTNRNSDGNEINRKEEELEDTQTSTKNEKNVEKCSTNSDRFDDRVVENVGKQVQQKTTSFTRDEQFIHLIDSNANRNPIIINNIIPKTDSNIDSIVRQTVIPSTQNTANVQTVSNDRNIQNTRTFESEVFPVNSLIRVAPISGGFIASAAVPALSGGLNALSTRPTQLSGVIAPATAPGLSSGFTASATRPDVSAPITTSAADPAFSGQFASSAIGSGLSGGFTASATRPAQSVPITSSATTPALSGGFTASATRPDVSAPITTSAADPAFSGQFNSSETAQALSGGFTASATRPDVSAPNTTSAADPTLSAQLNSSETAQTLSGGFIASATRPAQSVAITSLATTPGISNGFTGSATRPDVSAPITTSSGAPTLSGQFTSSETAQALSGGSTSSANRPALTAGIISSAAPAVSSGFNVLANRPSQSDPITRWRTAPAFSGGFRTSMAMPFISNGYSGSVAPVFSGGFRGSMRTPFPSIIRKESPIEQTMATNFFGEALPSMLSVSPLMGTLPLLKEKTILISRPLPRKTTAVYTTQYTPSTKTVIYESDNYPLPENIHMFTGMPSYGFSSSLSPMPLGLPSLSLTNTINYIKSSFIQKLLNSPFSL